MAEKLKVLVVAQTPPPFHGQAIMTQYFLEGRYETIELHHVRMAFSQDIQQVGKAGAGKVIHLLGLVRRIVMARLRLKPGVLYFPPASPNLAPFLRDCAILILTRWMFSKTVFHFHATGISEFRKKLPKPLQWLYRLAYNQPDLSICLSALAEDDARDFRSRKIAVVPNGIPDHPDAAYWRRPDTTPAVILYLGTVSEEKGVGVLLQSLALLAEKKWPLRCVIAGPFASPEDASLLQKQCASLGLDQYVTWRGTVTGEAKWECYREADIFCFPSHYQTEGFPVVLLEAMMFSLPAVATTWRAISEIILDGKTGFLAPIQDPRTTADKLAKLLRNPILRQVMGNAARKRFETHYTVENFRRAMEEALSLVGKGGNAETKDLHL